MKTFYSVPTHFLTLLITGGMLLSAGKASAQCTPQGDQTTYGTNNTWIGYVYQEMAFNIYKGYVNEGVPGNSNFDESFGGSQVNYNTNGCSVYTDTFSVRYKLTQTFASGNYQFIVGGDDGFRFSLDGGATWAINSWADHAYTTSTYTIALSGSYNMVLEYYEHTGFNRISFNLSSICTGTGDPTIFGTNNVWNGYIYQGMTFNLYKGSVTEGTAANPNFDENFGTAGSTPVTYTTNSCSIQTAQFSARYRLQKTFATANNVIITVGGDDGYRFSLDGGSTWVINKWNDQSYNVTTYTSSLAAGTYNMVLEYYQNGGNNRVSFSMSTTLLPVKLISWSATALSAEQELLQWKCTDAVKFDHFEIERSTDGQDFQGIHQEMASAATAGVQQSYSFTDQYSYNGTVLYRLAMVDQDGNTSYSNTVTLDLKQTKTISIYPTVVQDGNIFIESTRPVNQVKLEVFDMSGRKLNEKDWAVLSGRQQLSLIGNGRAGIMAGLYVVRLSDNNSILAKQIVIVK